MTAFAIGDEEWAATRKVDHLARDLYNALRRRMDFATGIVGGLPTRRISWYALREDTELESRPGVRGGKPSEQALRRRVEQLEKVGLVESIGTKLQLRFRLLLARRSSFDPKKAGGGAEVSRTASKPAPGKGSKGYAQGRSGRKAGTHQVSGKTNTPPNPPRDSQGVHPAPHACGAGGEMDPQHHQAGTDNGADQPPRSAESSEKAITPPPHACGAGGESDPQPPRATAQQLSEERHEHENGGGEGPPAQLAERGVGALEWEEHLAWPVRVTPEQRAYLAQVKREEGETLLQRVLDELRGAVASVPGGIKDEWAYFHVLLRNAKEKGDAWQTVYAEKIALARQNVARTMAQQKVEDAAYAASIGGVPGYPGKGELRKLVRGGAQR